MMCWQRVVLPEDSGPNISVILPLGMPPIPRAASKASDPVGIALTFRLDDPPSFIMEPSP